MEKFVFNKKGVRDILGAYYTHFKHMYEAIPVLENYKDKSFSLDKLERALELSGFDGVTSSNVVDDLQFYGVIVEESEVEEDL